MTQQLNLFNPRLVAQKPYFSASAMLWMLALVAAGTALLAAFAGYRVYDLRSQLSDASSRLAATQAQLAKVNADLGARVEDNLLAGEIRKVDADVQALRRVFDVLQNGDLGNSQGYSEYMRALARQVIVGLWLTRFDIHGAGNEIRIQGRALQPELVPEYIGRLGKESVMHGKSFATLEIELPGLGSDESAHKRSAKPERAAFVEFNLQSSGITEPAAGGQAR